MLIPLAPFDYYLARPEVAGIQFMFWFDGHQPDESRLRSSLRDVLRWFPPLTSRLVRVGDSELALRGLDVDPLEAATFRAVPLERDPDWDDPMSIATLFERVVNVEDQPLLKVTLHQASDRSYLAVSLSHMAADAHSLFGFLHAWAARYRGERFTPPTHERAALRDGLPDDGGPLTWDRIFADTGYLQWAPCDQAPETLTRETLRFSRADLEALKREARADERGLRLNDVVAAHLAKRFHRFVMAPEEDIVYVRCPVDYRHVHPGLSPTFFGNAVLDAVAVFDRETLPALPLGEVAVRIRAAITGIDAAAVRRSLACYERLRRERGLDGFRELVDRGFAVPNMSRLNRDPPDFGGSRPSRMICGSVTYRTANVISCPEGLEVQFAHAPEGLGRPLRGAAAAGG